MKNYISLHTHTTFSVGDSTSQPEDFIQKCVENNMTAIAFTEHGVVHEWIKKKQLCDKAKVKYIHGVELYVTESTDVKIRDNLHMVALAKNYAGVEELNYLTSISTLPEQKYYKPRITIEQACNISNNIILLGGCLGGVFANLPLDNPLIDRLDYVEIQPHVSERQKSLNIKALESGKRLVATGDYHEVSDYKAECRKIMLMRNGIEYEGEEEFNIVFKNYSDFRGAFIEQDTLPIDAIDEAIENTNIIASMIEDFTIDTSFKYPSLYDNPKQALVDKVNEALSDMDLFDNQEALDRVEHELSVIEKLGAESFMLFMSEAAEYCKRQNIAVGPARGSCSGSYVAYLLNIIGLDAIEWKTNFVRFMNEDRISLTDIDTDFESANRGKMFDFIKEKFGLEKSAHIITYQKLGTKSIIDAVGRYINLGLDEVAKIKRGYDEYEKLLIKNNRQFDNGLISESEHESEQHKIEDEIDEYMKQYSNVFYYYKGLKGAVSSTGIHACGILGSPVDLTKTLGVKYDEKKRHYVTSCSMKLVDGVNYVKYDILGLSTLDKIKGTFDFLGKPIPTIEELDVNDMSVFESMKRSPVGLFQMESNSAWRYLCKFDPKSISDIALVSAVIRPSCASFRDALIDRKHNINPDPRIDKLLESTLGYLVYQEQQIEFLQVLCGFSASKADGVRRAIGKKDKALLDSLLPDIEAGYIANSPKTSEEATKDIRQFMQVFIDSADYSFSYNHAIAYSMITYLSAYARHYYPTEFTASYLNCSKSDEDIVSGTELASVLGIDILKPTFGQSIGMYRPDGKRIYKGLTSVVNVSENVANELFDFYKSNKELVIEDFSDLVFALSKLKSMDKTKMETLIKIGYFHEYGSNKKLLKFYQIFRELDGKKQLSKEKIKPGVDAIVKRLLVSNSTGFSETAKTYKIDSVRVIKEVFKVLPNTEFTELERATHELSYLNYIQSDDINKEKVGVVLYNKSKNDSYYISGTWMKLAAGLPELKKGDIIWIESYSKYDKTIHKYTLFELDRNKK